MTEQDTPVRDWPKFDMVQSMNDLSLGEMEEWEDLTGLVFTATSRSGMPAKGLIGLMFIAYRRSIPDLTIEEVRSRTIADLGGAEDAVATEDEDPS